MNAAERVGERLKNAMDGLLREFAADGTEPLGCTFLVQINDGVATVQASGSMVVPGMIVNYDEPETPTKVVKRK